MEQCKTIAICNQKGGVGKTTTTLNLGIGLARQGKRILLIDLDPQSNLTDSLGWEPDSIEQSLGKMMFLIIRDQKPNVKEYILHHEEGVDLIPSNLDLSSLETLLINAMSRERVLDNLLQTVKKDYDYILIDCMPSLGMLTVNALTAADSVIIPVQAHYLPAKGMTQLLQSINKVRLHTNNRLEIEGIVMTLVDNRTNISKEVIQAIRMGYGMDIRVFRTEIPFGVKAAEAAKTGHSIYSYDAGGKPAKAYEMLTREVIQDAEKERGRDKAALAR